MTDRRLITRVVLRNYKSIAGCDVAPAQVSFLVGANGSGKSNFLDALRFVADSLRSSLDHALRERGGINDIRRRSSGHPNHFAIRLDFRLPEAVGRYAFEIGAKPRGAYAVRREDCQIESTVGAGGVQRYRVGDGVVSSSTLGAAPAASSDRLYLVNVSGLPAFRPVYDALSSMGFYNLSPDEIRDLQSPDPGHLLARDGHNLASVLALIASEAPALKGRIEEYLSRVVPGISGVDTRTVGPKETLEFRQVVSGAKDPWRFLASNMSDGTLRALAVLVALFQSSANGGSRLIGLEEPEIALHPGAAGILTDALRDAGEHVQVLLTSHSPDLLDNEEIPGDSIFAVVAEEGSTRIGPLDHAGRTALRDHLYTAGELLRMNQLRPEPAPPRQLDIFDDER